MLHIAGSGQSSDYVIATGITTTIRDFVLLAAKEAGLTIEFRGEGAEEKGYLVAVNEEIFKERVGEQYLADIVEKSKSQKVIVGVDPQYFRPTEVDLLIGDPTKSNTVLGWIPEYDLAALVEDMMQSDIKLFKKDAYLKAGGYQVMNYFE